jgi:hypothetical protein
MCEIRLNRVLYRPSDTKPAIQSRHYDAGVNPWQECNTVCSEHDGREHLKCFVQFGVSRHFRLGEVGCVFHTDVGADSVC